MSQENLATFRDPVTPEAGSLKLEVGGEVGLEAAGQEVRTGTQREISHFEELGKSLADDPEAQTEARAAVIELEDVRQKYEKQLDSTINPEAQETTIREPAKVYDLAPESLRAERLRKRMEHEAEPTLMVVTLKEEPTPEIETSPLAQSVRMPEPKTGNEPTLKSAEVGEPTLVEEDLPTLEAATIPVQPAESVDADLSDLESSESGLELAVTPEDVRAEKNVKVLKATVEGLKELSGDEWSDLYQQSELAWTPEIWQNLSDQAPANDNSEREQLRRLAINKAEMEIGLLAGAAALGSLERRKIEQGLAQDQAKEKELFNIARERAEAIEVDVSELDKDESVDVDVSEFQFKPKHSDEELEKIAKESALKKSPSKAGGLAKRAGKGALLLGGGLIFGGVALGLKGAAKVAGYVLSGKAAFSVLDWIDKGMEKIQRLAFKNDLNVVFEIAKNAGDSISKKLDELGAKTEKKKTE